MKTCELGLIENKPSVEKITYFFIDNFNIAYSQPHIPRTMATPVFGKKHMCRNSITYCWRWNFELLNDDNDCSQTLDLIGSAYTDIKYKKSNDIFQRDTKNDLSEFIQN